MKKLISVAILSLYLITATEFYQLLKLPLLIDHFIQHKEENKSVTLLSFLQMHYIDPTVKDADYEQDMKLPFKTHSENAQHSILALIPQKSAAVLKKTYVEPRIFLVQEELFSTSSYLSGIWQPPKFY